MAKNVRCSITAVLLLCVAAVPVRPARAADYDWREPGKAETAAVLSCLRQGDTAGLVALFEDGLDIDQLLPLDNDHIPILSLAISTGRLKLVEFILAEGADVDTMSTTIMQHVERVTKTFTVRY